MYQLVCFEAKISIFDNIMIRKNILLIMVIYLLTRNSDYDAI